MKLFSLLDEELQQAVPQTTYAPYYFRYLGYKDALGADITTLRASGIHALLSKTVPRILKNEWLAGNTRSLFCEADALTLNYAKKITDAIPQRSFVTNKDHFAPDYEHVLRVGLPGMLGEIEESLKAHREDAKRVNTLMGMKTALRAGSQGAHS